MHALRCRLGFGAFVRRALLLSPASPAVLLGWGLGTAYIKEGLATHSFPWCPAFQSTQGGSVPPEPSLADSSLVLGRWIPFTTNVQWHRMTCNVNGLYRRRGNSRRLSTLFYGLRRRGQHPAARFPHGISLDCPPRLLGFNRGLGLCRHVRIWIPRVQRALYDAERVRLRLLASRSSNQLLDLRHD